MRILGIDPGIRNTGWGVIEQKSNRLIHVANGVIQPEPHLSDAERLGMIATSLEAVITHHNPDLAVIEEIFVAKSAVSALKLGMARGVALMQCGKAGLTSREIAARKVKKAVTGSGRADKSQMQAMVERLLGVKPANADAADALAIAIAAGHEAALGDLTASANAPNRIGKNAGLAVGSSEDDSDGGGLQAAIRRALARDIKEGG